MNLPGRLFVRNLIERRALLYQMVRRDFEQRYVGSAAGWLWGIIHPLVMLLVWKFVFETCMKIQMPRGEVTQNYTLFLLAGYLPWFLFQETVQRSANSLVEHSNLITKTVFPSEIVPIAIFFSSLVNHFFTILLLVGATAWWMGHFSWMLVFLPLYTLLTGMLAIGIVWIAASLQVYLRDTAQVTQVILTLWMWMTPVFLYESYYPEKYQWIIDYNPLAYVVRNYRDRILSGELPRVDELGVIAFYSVTAMVAGGLFFRQLKRGFADVL
ncbi:MAG: ABC transporter permease [Bryobacterales bacterium]|nr:ABC transporter permease [Bryobacterales bacterium]